VTALIWRSAAPRGHTKTNRVRRFADAVTEPGRPDRLDARSCYGEIRSAAGDNRADRRNPLDADIGVAAKLAAEDVGVELAIVEAAIVRSGEGAKRSLEWVVTVQDGRARIEEQTSA
jgi:hypothetical protein